MDFTEHAEAIEQLLKKKDALGDTSTFLAAVSLRNSLVKLIKECEKNAELIRLAGLKGKPDYIKYEGDFGGYLAHMSCRMEEYEGEDYIKSVKLHYTSNDDLDSGRICSIFGDEEYWDDTCPFRDGNGKKRTWYIKKSLYRKD